MLQVNEIFGPTVQGEGAAAGRHCLFLRLTNCNLRCQWCDTAYTWAFNYALAQNLETTIIHNKEANLKEMTTQEVLDALRGFWDVEDKPTIIVISGGEPLMQGQGVTEVARTLSMWRNEVHIETAGTIMPPQELDFYVAQYNVSPKMQNSGNELRKRFKQDVLEWFAQNPRAWFKFVVRDRYDLSEVDSIVDKVGIRTSRVMVMPEGVTPEENMRIAREVAESAIARGYGLSFRTHIMLWPDEVRGH